MSDSVISYDADYYANYFGGLAYTRDEPHWAKFFADVAKATVANLRPATALDAGCAHGFFVEALRNEGVDAAGFDISEFAVSQMPEEYKDYVRVGSILDPFGSRYDMISCIEVIEHLAAPDARTAIKNLTDATDTILFSSTPSDWDEPTHINVQPPEYWARLFAEQGFFRDPFTSAEFLAPWAAVYKRSNLSTDEATERLEREAWALRSENRSLRAALNHNGTPGNDQDATAQVQRAFEVRSREVDQLRNALQSERTARLNATDAAIGAERSAGHARAEAGELLMQLNAAIHQIDLLGGIGAELHQLRNSPSMRVASRISRAAAAARRVTGR